MNFTSFDAVFFTAAFLVPGFVSSAVLSMLLRRRLVGPDARYLEYLTLSCINYGLWSWALVWVFRTRFIENYPYLSGLFAVVIMFVSPMGLGFLSARAQQKEWVSLFLRRLGVRTVDAIPTAWDWYFRQKKPSWMLVTLKNDSRVYGLYGGPGSFAGDDPQHRDLFLEATYRPLANSEWAPVEDTGGILIMNDQIATIEFRKLNGENP